MVHIVKGLCEEANFEMDMQGKTEVWDDEYKPLCMSHSLSGLVLLYLQRIVMICELYYYKEQGTISNRQEHNGAHTRSTLLPMSALSRQGWSTQCWSSTRTRHGVQKWMGLH